MSEEVEKVFKEHKIVPDMLESAPKEFLKVNFADNLEANRGNELTPTQVKVQPRVEWTSEESAFYTLTMTDPDAPSRTDSRFGEYQHWLVVNVPGNNIAKGDVLTDYVGSGPPKGSGLHRYVLLVFKQNAKQKFSEEIIPKNSGRNRNNFNSIKFAKKYKLGAPIAGNFFHAKYDDYVPTVHKQLSGK